MTDDKPTIPEEEKLPRMIEAIEDVYLAENAEFEARLTLEKVYKAGRGTPSQRKEAREILGEDAND